MFGHWFIVHNVWLGPSYTVSVCDNLNREQNLVLPCGPTYRVGATIYNHMGSVLNPQKVSTEQSWLSLLLHQHGYELNATINQLPHLSEVRPHDPRCRIFDHHRASAINLYDADTCFISFFVGIYEDPLLSKSKPQMRRVSATGGYRRRYYYILRWATLPTKCFEIFTTLRHSTWRRNICGQRLGAFRGSHWDVLIVLRRANHF